MATVSFHSGATSGGQVAMNPTPANVAVATTSNYVNSATLLAAASDGSNLLAKRDVDEQLIKRYGNQGITGLMELLGTKKETTQQKFEHYEETFLHNAFDATIDANGDFTIANAFDDDGDGTGNTALRDGDIIMGGSGVLYYVNAADAAQPNNDFTIKNVSNGTRASAGSDTKFCIVGNAYAERTDQPGEGITPRVIQYSNRCQIIKESFSVSGSEATNAIYVKVNNQEFGTGYLWYLQGEADTYQRFMDYCELAMIVGDQGDGTLSNTDSDDASTPFVSTTEGLLKFIENKGQTMDLGSSAITMADFDAAIKSLDKFRGAKEMALYAGINLSLDIDDLLAAQGAYAAGGANYGTFANSKDIALNLGFNSFTRGGYTFHKKTYDLFNRPDLLGGDGFKFNGFGMCIPMDNQRDPRSGESIPSLRMRYKAANGYSREMEHWLTGSAVLQNRTNEKDELRSHYRTERGFEGFAPNRFLLFKKS
tara:strand:- start:608 stop:2050 length:1443 start_codon:yes stop_codon:yes gene_type:complete